MVCKQPTLGKKIYKQLSGLSTFTKYSTMLNCKGSNFVILEIYTFKYHLIMTSPHFRVFLKKLNPPVNHYHPCLTLHFRRKYYGNKITNRKKSKKIFSAII